MKEYPQETVFRVRTLPGGRGSRMLWLMWVAGMGGMLVGLVVTLGNPLGGAAGLVLPMLWLTWKMTTRAEYGVSSEGVRETLLDAQGKPKGGGEKRYRWDQIESWIVDADQVRGVGERRFVELRMRDGYRMRFREANDRPSDPEFSAFATELERNVGGALPPVTPLPSPAPSGPPRLPPPVPKRRRSFYERPIAKILTIIFIALTVGLLLVAVFAPQYFSAASWFRMLVVVIPGCLYMVSRSFGRR